MRAHYLRRLRSARNVLAMETENPASHRFAHLAAFTALQGVLLLAVLAGLLLAAAHTENPYTGGPHNPGAVMANRPDAQGSPAALIAEHDCWTGKAPAGKTFGHAVVTMRGAIAPRFVGPRLAGLALDKAFGKDVPSIDTVHGFCE